MKREEVFGEPDQNCKKLDAISSSSSSRIVSPSSSFGCLVPLATLMVIFGVTGVLEKGAD